MDDSNDQVNYSEIINETASKHYNVRDEFKDNTPAENKNICRADSLDFAVGAFSITGDLNIGIMIRTASLLGARAFYIFGRRKYDKRSTVGAHHYIDIHKLDATVEDISYVTDRLYTPVFVEQGGYDLPFRDLDYEIFKKTFPPMFIFGSESEGIPPEIMEAIPNITYSIPQRGVLRSFNVSSAMAIVAWEYSRLLIKE